MYYEPFVAFKQNRGINVSQRAVVLKVSLLIVIRGSGTLNT